MCVGICLGPQKYYYGKSSLNIPVGYEWFSKMFALKKTFTNKIKNTFTILSPLASYQDWVWDCW